MISQFGNILNEQGKAIFKGVLISKYKDPPGLQVRLNAFPETNP
jgi:hypothetical protein